MRDVSLRGWKLGRYFGALLPPLPGLVQNERGQAFSAAVEEEWRPLPPSIIPVNFFLCFLPESLALLCLFDALRHA